MESKKIISLIFTFIMLFGLNTESENIDIAPLISLDQIEPTYDQEENTDLNQNKDESSKIVSNKMNNKERIVTIKILNKITTKVEQLKMRIKENYKYEYLEIYAIDCFLSNEYEKTEKAVYLNIYNRESNKKIFNGWMLKTLPSISSLEHPIYDVWVEDCN